MRKFLFDALRSCPVDPWKKQADPYRERLSLMKAELLFMGPSAGLANDVAAFLYEKMNGDTDAL